MSAMRDAAMTSKAWPFEAARGVLKRYEKAPPEKGYVLFETGYGPSGLPHIGTFGEVLRTTMIRRAFELISDIPTKLICFSDDLDGMRKVPGNVPQQDMLAEHMHRPLTDVPDPFGTHESFGHHNNAMLRRFLDTFGFEYEFYSAREFYRTGQFDEILKRAVERYDDVMKVMLKSLREERQQTYSIFLPIHPETGRVLYVPMKHVDAVNHTITFDDETGREWTLPVTGGNVKLQWKPDFGARWAALGVDFEMYGKDHQASAPLYDAICKIAGGRTPVQYVYEMFLDGEGKKISKSKGNGISMEQWLTYAPKESLSYYMFLSPRKAKRLHFDVIPKAVDEYQSFLGKFADADEDAKLKSPVWHIHDGNPPAAEEGPTYNLLLNLASVCNPEDKGVLWGFINSYMPEATPESHPFLDSLAETAVRYYHDFIKPEKSYRAADEMESKALADLSEYLKKLPDGVSAQDLQQSIFDIGKRYYDPKEIKKWFSALYETLLGAKQGPRMGSFIALYGVTNTATLIDKVLAGEDLALAS